MNTPLLSLQGISFSYAGHAPDNAPLLLDQIGFDLGPGERLGLCGPNGCGKSTLLHLATGLLKPLAGSVFFKGKLLLTEKDFQPARPMMGYVLQHSEDQLFCPVVLEDVAFGPLNLGKSREDSRRIAQETLNRLHISRLAGRSGHNLSGGEKKLAALAAVLSMDPVLLLLDEPTSGLDPASRERLTGILTGLDKPFVVVSHDRAFLDRICTRRLILEKGKLSATG